MGIQPISSKASLISASQTSHTPHAQKNEAISKGAKNSINPKGELPQNTPASTVTNVGANSVNASQKVGPSIKNKVAASRF